jgi:hypothetical protein
MRAWVLSLLMVALCFFPPDIRAESPQVTGRWTAPTEGSPVVFYELEVLAGEEPFLVVTTEDTQYLFAPGTFEVDVPYVARVRGVDAKDREGPWSEWSEPFIWDPGPPGGCGPFNWIVGG